MTPNQKAGKLTTGSRSSPRFHCQDCDALREGSHCPECGGRTDMYLTAGRTALETQGEEKKP
jgi:hypothetical protein